MGVQNKTKNKKEVYYGLWEMEKMCEVEDESTQSTVEAVPAARDWKIRRASKQSYS